MRSAVSPRPWQQIATGILPVFSDNSTRAYRKAVSPVRVLASIFAIVSIGVLTIGFQYKESLLGTTYTQTQSRRSLAAESAASSANILEPVNSTASSSTEGLQNVVAPSRQDMFFGSAPIDLLQSLDWAPVSKWLTLAEIATDRNPSDASDLCRFLFPLEAETVALVGNGPLSAEDHRSINESSWVIRFNYMDNLLPGEHTDLWVGRTDMLDYSHWQRSESYYPSDAPDAASAAQRHVLLGESPSLGLSTAKAFRVPEEKLRHALRLDLSALSSVYNSARVGKSPRKGIPTSGFLVAVAAASCTQGKSQQVHVYGANWSRLQLPMLHYSEQEAIIVQGLEDQKLITVYKPPCGGHDDTKQGTKDALRSCGDVDHALCREAWRNCEAVPTAMLADMFATLSLPKLLSVTRESSIEVAGQPNPESTESKALAAVWEGPEAAKKAQDSAFCKPFMGSGSAKLGGKRIAIVGNGPLSVEQRADIGNYDSVVRFNYLNNRLPGEKMDVWVACFGWKSNSLYWGFAQGSRSEAVEALATNATVVLFGGFGAVSAVPLLRQFPEVQLDKVVYLDLAYSDEQFYSGYKAAFGKSSDKFLTTGFRVVLATLACQAPGAEVHLFGFNWSPLFWSGHDTTLERRVLVAFANAGNLQVHMPPCDGVRRCDKRDIHDYSVRLEDGYEGVPLNNASKNQTAHDTQ